MKILVSELMPGDIISLSVYQEAISVPADVVLLHGTAVCDEALLTGESIPQRKQPLQSASHNGNKDEYTDECLDINDIVYKESILFGGTTLLVTTSEDDNKDTNNSTAKHLSMLQTNGTTVQEPPPPDQGIIGMVIRTGFETTQGNLLRTMVHSSSSGNNNETHNTMDTFVFIALLLLCAIGAAMYVLSVGWHDERRNHFRLILHVIMIITSVVPPELPMELSLAITNSVGDLIRRCHVYCTEHYRIPYAGQVNICCFDKTGTLYVFSFFFG
jgi:cation-transporting ATPase 13A1